MKGGRLTRTPLPQQNAHAMIRRRAAGADITTQVGNHTFRATGITAYLKNGGMLEKAAALANYASTRTTQLYDRHQPVPYQLRHGRDRMRLGLPFQKVRLYLDRIISHERNDCAYAHPCLWNRVSTNL